MSIEEEDLLKAVGTSYELGLHIASIKSAQKNQSIFRK